MERLDTWYGIALCQTHVEDLEEVEEVAEMEAVEVEAEGEPS